MTDNQFNQRNTNFENVIQDYITWSNTFHSAGTTKSYVNSYIKNLIKQLLDPEFTHLLGEAGLFESYSKDKRMDNKHSLIVCLSECIIEREMKTPNSGSTSWSKKTLTNYRSGLRSFFEFLDQEGWFFAANISVNCLKKAITGTSTTITYSNDQIKRIFKSRLITQDRAYGHMIFPVRVIGKLMNHSAKADDYKNLLNDCIDSTKFAVSNNGSYIPLKDIRCVEIDPKTERVTITQKKGGKVLDVYTQVPGSAMCEPLQTKVFKDLSLDHAVSLKKLLDDSSAQKRFPTLYQLSVEYASFVCGTHCPDDFLKIASQKKTNIRDFKKYSNLFYQYYVKQISGNPSGVISVGQLFSELYDLFTNNQLIVMLTRYNSSLGDKS